MALNNIENLLEKYNNGETSLKEEQQLKNYFSQETVAPHLEMYKPLFTYFIVNKQEQFTKDIPLNTKKTFNYKWLSVAAVAVLMFAFYINNPFGNAINEQDKLDYNNAKKALALVSKHYNKAAKQIAYIDVVSKAGKQVDYLQEVNNPMQRILKQ